MHPKIVPPRRTLTPDQGLPTAQLADMRDSMLVNQSVRLLVTYNLELLQGFEGFLRSVGILRDASQSVAHLLCPAGASIGIGQD